VSSLRGSLEAFEARLSTELALQLRDHLAESTIVERIELGV
jgi:hypothetical protein